RRVVIAVAGPMKAVRRKLIPLLARHLARFTTNAQSRVSKKAHLLLLLRRFGPLPCLGEVLKHRTVPPADWIAAFLGLVRAWAMAPVIPKADQCVPFQAGRRARDRQMLSLREC